MAGPMYHVGAFDLPGIGTWWVGGSLVILPRFDVPDLLAAIERERPTNVWLAPAMVNATLTAIASPRARQPQHREHPVHHRRRGEDAGDADRAGARGFPNARFADAYGLTETVSGDTFNDQAHTLSKIGSVGKPVVNLDVRISAPTTPGRAGRPGRDLAARTQGGVRLLEEPGRHRGGVHGGRLVPHRGHRPPRRGRVPLHRRPQEGHDRLRRRERRHVRGGARLYEARRSSRPPWSPCPTRAGARCRARSLCCQPGRRSRAGADRALPVAAGRLQDAEVGRVPRRAAAQPVGQGAQARAARDHQRGRKGNHVQATQPSGPAAGAPELPTESLLEAYGRMTLIRVFEERVSELYRTARYPASCTCRSARRRPRSAAAGRWPDRRDHLQPPGPRPLPGQGPRPRADDGRAAGPGHRDEQRPGRVDAHRRPGPGHLRRQRDRRRGRADRRGRGHRREAARAGQGEGGG